jgi:hypothetical protein
MRLLETRNRINELLSRFVTQVKGSSALGQNDIKTVAETVMIPILRLVYGYSELKNLNLEVEANFPGIDLGDEKAKVSIQVTATSASSKVEHTLSQFKKYELNKKYNRLIIYVISEKQKSYTSQSFQEIAKDTVDFNPSRDIWDYTDILKEVAGMELDRALELLDILEKNFGDGQKNKIIRQNPELTETVYLNLLEIYFPKQLYIADTTENLSSRGRKSERQIVQDGMKKAGIRFGVDWECHEKKIATFHNLSDSELPLSRIIDKGTVDVLSTEDYFSADGDYERVFKSLLRRCLQQKLFHKKVFWQNEEHLFMFSPRNDEAERIEKWVGKVESSRQVYAKTMKNNKPDEILNCKHLAFRVQFKRMASRWFLAIEPDWFFSIDGYRKNPFSESNLEWLKRKETNGHVYNHLRFICYFLKHEPNTSIFEHEQSYPYLFLNFGELKSFSNAPELPDALWLVKPSDSDKEELEDDLQEGLFAWDAL